MEFEYPKRLTSFKLNKDFWLNGKWLAPIDGFPVYTFREIEILKKNKDKLTLEFLQTIYDTKLAIARELTFLELTEKKEKEEINVKGHMENIKKALGA